MSNATWVAAMVCVGPKLTPPSVELLSAIEVVVHIVPGDVQRAIRATNGSAPMTAFGPPEVSLAATGAENVTPPSLESADQQMLPLRTSCHVALSQAT